MIFIESYLSERTQQVKYDEEISDPLEVLLGLPQGSILGPWLLVLYTHQISKLYYDEYNDFNAFFNCNTIHQLKNIRFEGV